MEWGPYTDGAEPHRNMDYANHPAYPHANSVPRSQSYPAVYNDPYMRLSQPEVPPMPPSPYEQHTPYYYPPTSSAESYPPAPLPENVHYAHTQSANRPHYNSAPGYNYPPHNIPTYSHSPAPHTPTSTVSDPTNDRDSQDPELGPPEQHSNEIEYRYAPADPPPAAATPAPAASSPRSHYLCDNPGCKKVYPRLCDLRKHKKRHLKPFSCRDPACETLFSTEKDRDRHERSKHRREEHLVCAMCGHRTARKDNMKDHVRRRHGEQDLERIMEITMRA